MGEYSVSIKSIDELTVDIRRKMLSLYLSHYDGCTEAQMLSDLAEKREALILYCDREIVGFTTVQVYEREWQDQRIRVVYSGDTIVDRSHWGQQSLANHWISHITRIKLERPELPLYWFVIVKGHRTFKYLPAFGKSFYPHWSIDRSDLKPLVDQLAADKFGHLYNRETGVVEYDRSRGHLKQEIAFPSEEELNKESVRFFLSRNPGYLKGHELACICELEEENMKAFTKRIFRKACNVYALAKTG
jgi:hypothetical protein